jgi:hypothetical protein
VIDRAGAWCRAGIFWNDQLIVEEDGLLLGQFVNEVDDGPQSLALSDDGRFAVFMAWVHTLGHAVWRRELVPPPIPCTVPVATATLMGSTPASSMR